MGGRRKEDDESGMAVKAQEHGRLCQQDVRIRQWVLEYIAEVRRVTAPKMRGESWFYPANGSG